MVPGPNDILSLPRKRLGGSAKSSESAHVVGKLLSESGVPGRASRQTDGPRTEFAAWRSVARTGISMSSAVHLLRLITCSVSYAARRVLKGSEKGYCILGLQFSRI